MPSLSSATNENWQSDVWREPLSFREQIAFAYLPSCVEKLVIGMRSVEEVESAMAAMAEVVPSSIWSEAQAMGLLPASLPLLKHD